MKIKGRIALIGLLAVALLLGNILSAFPLARSVYADTETLRPNAAGDATNLVAYPGTGEANWEDVDDVTPDEDDTRTGRTGATWLGDLYNLSATTGSGTINSITIYARTRAAATPNQTSLNIYLKTGGSTSEQGAVTVTTSYVDYSWVLNTNPITSVAWTWGDLASLQVGTLLRRCEAATATGTRVTQVYVVVDYTAVTAPSVTTSAATNVEEVSATGNGNITSLEGGGNCTVRGFEWDYDTGAPYNYSTYETGSFGTGAYSLSITGIDEGQLVYFRAYATNPNGTGYGSELTFLTKPDPPLTFTATAVGETQIDLAWTNGDGAQQVYIRGKLGSAPTNRTDGAYSWNGSGTSTQHTGLSSGQHWYYIIWSYATEGGLTQTSDTPDLSDDATTVTAPTIASLQVEGTGSYIFGRWVILRGRVTDDQGLTIDTVGFEYGLTDAYGADVSQVGSWNTGDEFVLWTGVLSSGTTYHWRAFASSGGVTGSGEDMYFTTEGSETIYEYLNTGQDGYNDIYGTFWVAQYFTTGTIAHSVTSIRLYLERVLGDPGTIIVSLRHCDDSHKPTGADLCSGTLDGGNLFVAYQWVEFDVDEISLEASTEYAIVVRAPAGDAANYFIWGADTGGGLANAYGWNSSTGGISWVSDSPYDYLFEIWGNPVITINSAAVFRGYYDDDDDDMLFVISYENTYPPYYPDEDCPTYFSLRLYDMDGVTPLASTPCQAWGCKPSSIYLSGDLAETLNEGAGYYIKLVLNDDETVVASYQLLSSDWKGDNLNTLDRWVMTTAHQIEAYYSEVFGMDITLTEFISSNEVLNEQGGIIFALGIADLQNIRPNLFKTIAQLPGYEAEEWTFAFGDVDWEEQVGPEAVAVLEEGGNLIGIEGKGLGVFFILGGYLIVALVIVGKGNREAGFAGVCLAIPILILGTWLRMLDIVFIAVAASVAIGLFVYSMWFSRT